MPSSKCDECKWWMSFQLKCLLGRNPERCTSMIARRGDDELADRVAHLPPEDMRKMRRRLSGDAERTVTVRNPKVDDWK